MWAALHASACVATIGDAPADRQPPLESPAPPFEPGEGRIRRLTSAQYANVIRDIVGPEIVLPPRLEADTDVGGLLEVGGGLNTISARGVEQYEAAAYSIAEQALAHPDVRARILPCEPVAAVDTACATAFVNAFGHRAFRRPLLAVESELLVEVASLAATTLGSFDDGVVYAMAAMLQSPSFLFRTEIGDEDPDAPGWRRLGGYEIASRLSFFFWNTTPDPALLEAAANGALDTDEGIAAEIDRLLEDPRIYDGVRAFFSDMLRLRALDSLDKDPEIFVHMSAELGASAREETLLGIEHLVFDLDGDYRDLLTTRTAFLDRRLAAIYDLPAPAREGFAEQQLPEAGLRRGLLGQVSFLAANAHATTSSATLRGKFIREVLLCAAIPPPPANANTALPEPTEDAITLRDRVSVHMRSPSCRGCHQLMDPLGLAFENFDGIGRYRDTEGGVFIDATGDLAGVPFDDASQLAELLHDHPDVPRCLVRTMYRYANGRVEVSGETEPLRELTRTFEAEGYRVPAMMRAVAGHPSFYRTIPPEGTEED